MGLPLSAEQLLMARSSGYQIKQSLRCNADDAAHLSYTPGSSLSTRRQATWSTWIKRGKIGAVVTTDAMVLWGAGTGASTSDYIGFTNTGDPNRLWFFLGNVSYEVLTAPLYRDPSGFMHVVVVLDTPNAVANDRMRIYVNGMRVTNLAANNPPPQHYDAPYFFTSVAHALGKHTTAVYYFDGLRAEDICVSGQALDPTNFGEFDLVTGAWKPKKYAGTYGSHGHYLDFSDSSNTTSATLGKDRSGNNNDWTPSGFSVTAGVANDVLQDTPTNNYCTLNPINKHMGATCLLSDGNLNFKSTNGANYHYVLGTMAVRAGEKKAWEVTVGVSAFDTSTAGPGIATENWATRGVRSGDTANTDAQVYKYTQNGNKKNAASSVAFGSSFTTGDVIMVAVDATTITNVKVWWAKNGVWQASGDPATGANPAYSGIVGPVWPLLVSIANSAAGGDYVNFGQRPFSGTLPSGFSTLCNKDRPTPSVQNPRTRFDTRVYVGTGAARSLSGYLFQPDLVWTKAYASSGLTLPMTTQIRGTGKYKPQNNGVAEVTDAQAITAFNADGVSMGTAAVMNANAASYLAKLFKSDPANGIEIVTWTGDGAATKTISHSLGAAPSLIIAFGMGTQTSVLHHRKMPGATYFQQIGNLANSDSANANSPFSSNSASDIVVTNNATNNLNANGVVYWALLCTEGPLFASGEYTGNGDADGPFMDCGFRPAWAAWYAPNNVSWLSVSDDGSSGSYNGSTTINVDTPFMTYGVAFYSYAPGADLLSNGFKIRTSAANVNLNGNNKYWFAFAKQAGKYANAS